MALAASPSMLLRSGKHLLEHSPTIIVAGPSIPGGTSRVLSAHKREFPLDGQNLSTISYTQYRGTGVPLLELGEPGDLFIDLSPNTYRAFVRYRSWREWPGIHEDTDMSEDPLVTPYTHPKDPTRIIWCTQTDVVWYKITSVRLWKMRLFSSECYLGVTFISAHDLIRRSSIPCENENENRLLMDTSGREPKRRRAERPPVPDARDELHVHFDPTLGRDANSSTTLKRSMATISSPLNLSVSIDSDEDSDHQSMSEDIQVIIAQDRHFESSTCHIIHYTQYRGYGPPPPDLGSPGDMYIDTTPEAHRLFARYESWMEWTGVHRVQPSFRFPHPRDTDRQLWVTLNDILWFRGRPLWSARKRVLSFTTESFISAHTMIQKSGFLKQDLKRIKDKELDDDHSPEIRRRIMANGLVGMRKGISTPSDSDDPDDVSGSRARSSTSAFPRKKVRTKTPVIAGPPTNAYSIPSPGGTSSPLSLLPDGTMETNLLSPSAPSIPELPSMIPTSPNVFNYWDVEHTLRQISEDPYTLTYTPKMPQPPADETLQDNMFPQNTWPFNEYLHGHPLNPASNISFSPEYTIDPRILRSPSVQIGEQENGETSAMSLSSRPSIDDDQQTTLSRPPTAPLSASLYHRDVVLSSPRRLSIVGEEPSTSFNARLDILESQHTNRMSVPLSPPPGQAALETTIEHRDVALDHRDLTFRTRTFEKTDLQIVRYKQYCSHGPPPADLGSSGDMYFDISLPAHRLFIRYTRWCEWLGVYRTVTPPFEHPEDREIIVWCSINDVSWRRKSSTSHSRAHLFKRRNVPFVPAHTLIKRSGILDDQNWLTITETLTEDTQVVQSKAPDLDPPTDSPNIGDDPPPQAGVTTIVPLETPSQRPIENSTASNGVDRAKDQPVKIESDIIKTILGVGDMLKTEDNLKKRQERHRKRMIELAKKERELATQEERILWEEQQIKGDLERTNGNAIRLQERTKRLEDELLLEREDILSKEADISQREKALKQRKKLVAEMEGRISEWEHI